MRLVAQGCTARTGVAHPLRMQNADDHDAVTVG